MHWKDALVTAAGSLILALPAFGQAGTSGTSSTSAKSSDTAEKRTLSDQGAHPMRSADLLSALQRANQDEIAMANLAKERSSNKAVKDYADMIISDHKKADDEVQSFAKAHNVDLKQELHAVREARKDRAEEAARSREIETPTGEYMRPWPEDGVGGSGMTKEHQKQMSDLSKLKGAEFDRQFAKTMENDHRRLIDHLNRVRSRPEVDHDLMQLIDKMMPTLEKHENAAKQLQSRLS